MVVLQFGGPMKREWDRREAEMWECVHEERETNLQKKEKRKRKRTATICSKCKGLL